MQAAAPSLSRTYWPIRKPCDSSVPKTKLVRPARVDLLGDPLEADVHIVARLDAVAVADAADSGVVTSVVTRKWSFVSVPAFLRCSQTIVGQQSARAGCR